MQHCKRSDATHFNTVQFITIFKNGHGKIVIYKHVSSCIQIVYFMYSFNM